MKIFQKGFNFSQDGPGNRLVYHLAGCNMHCLWCANPEGMTAKETHKTYTPKELVVEAVSCRPFFFDGGGVTFTGGEATLYAEELIETLQRLQAEGIHTAIETNGTSPRLMDILPFVDYLIMDFKHVDDAVLLAYTGMDGKALRKNYEAICQSNRQCHIRIPLIQEFNGTAAKAIAAYLAKHATNHLVFEFLRYHEYGKEKWQEEYKITNGFVTDETVKEFQEEFKKHNLTYITT